jgi:hypothetical protein
VDVGDRLFSPKHLVWGIAKAIVPEADAPILFVQDDFEYNWWGTRSDFETESEHGARIESERDSIRRARDSDAEKKRIDESREELMYLLSRFVGGANLRETLRSTLQTRYVCPLCSEALLLPAGVDLSADAIAAMPHRATCDWFRAYELLKDLGAIR